MNITKGEISFLIKPVIFLVVLIILFILLISIGIRQVTLAIGKIDESKKVETALNQKITILQKVSQVISGDTTFLDMVVPSKTAVLYGLSQVKNQAYKSGLLISNIKTGTPVADKNNIYKTSISFDVDGNEIAIYDYLKSFSRVIPLMNVEKVKISNSATVARATATLSVYSSELPKTIPSISSVAVDLTDEELSLLNELVSYTLPVFAEPKATEQQVKEDPFN
ncbi:MAG: hypothetical protein AAB872_01120 [Patescibacteria group bacterium]